MFDSIPADWRTWLTENIILGNSESVAVETMIKSGFIPSEVQDLLNSIKSEYSLAVSNKYIQKLRKIESQLNIGLELRKLSKNNLKIDTKNSISQEVFLKNHYSVRKPLMIKNFSKSWPALEKWKKDYLIEKFGHLNIEIQAGRDSNENYEVESVKHKENMVFGEFLEGVYSGKETNDYYMVATNENFSKTEMLKLTDDLGEFPDFLDKGMFPNGIFVWLGPKGTITPLHHDTSNIILTQISGTKKVYLISPDQSHLVYNHIGVFSQVDLENPDYAKFPLFRNVIIQEVVLRPGEGLFIPVGWWHFVRSLDVSISLSFTNFIFPNSYEYVNPSQL